MNKELKLTYSPPFDSTLFPIMRLTPTRARSSLAMLPRSRVMLNSMRRGFFIVCIVVVLCNLAVTGIATIIVAG